MESIKVTFSNRIEALFQGLKGSIERNRTSPFEKIVIVVPSPAMKNYIMREFAHDPSYNIAFGLEIMTLDAAISYLFKYFDEENKIKLPNLFDLSLKIDFECEKLCQENHPLSPPLQKMGRYEMGASHLPKTFNEKKSRGKRRVLLAEEIADLFLKQQEFSKEEERVWEKEPNSHWSYHLWNKVFSKESHFRPLYQLVSKFKIKNNFPKIQVYLFGLSFISEEKFRFFQKISQKTWVQAFILSPTRMFSSDAKSFKEMSQELYHLMKKKRKEEELSLLEDFYLEGHPLIASFGKLYRTFMKQLDEEIVDIEEGYFVPDGTFDHPIYQDLLFDEVQEVEGEPITLLRALQTDLTLLRPINKEKISFKEDDHSIEVHEAPSISREVEIIYQRLLFLFTENPSLEPKDILVLVSDFALYSPWIEAIFTQAESPFKIALDDETALFKSPFIKTFFALLDLPISRYTVDHLFEIIEYPLIHKKGGLSLEEVKLIRRILEEKEVTFGKTRAHREAMIGSGPLIEKSERGTFQAAISELISQMGEGKEENYKIEMNFRLSLLQGEILGKTLALINKIETLLAPLEENLVKPLNEWALFFEKLLEDLTLEPSSLEDEDAKNELLLTLNSLSLQEGISLPFNSVKEHLRSKLSKSSLLHHEKDLQEIKFRGSLPMKGVPSKVIVWLGVSDGVFPKKGKKNTFSIKMGKYIPLREDFDRSLFLDTLLSTREHLILSYIMTPSPVITELLDTIEQSFTINKNQIVHKHKCFSFDKAYFSPESQLKNSSLNDYKALLSICSKKESSSLKKEPLPSLKSEENILPRHLHLNQLKRFSNHPIKYFFQETLGVYIKESENSDHTLEFEEETTLSYRLLPLALKEPLDIVLEIAKKNNWLPIAPFETVAKERLYENLSKQLSLIEEMGISKDEIFEVEFSYGVEKPLKTDSNKLLLPPVALNIDGRPVSITGSIPYVSSKGILFFKELHFENGVKHLPELLLSKYIPSQYMEKKAIFLNKKNELNLFFEITLEEYLKTFSIGIKQPLPLLPPWVKPLLDEDLFELKASIEKSTVGGYYQNQDPYLQWGVHLKEELTEDSLLPWKNIVKPLYTPLLESVKEAL